jgi:hypothetical protein
LKRIGINQERLVEEFRMKEEADGGRYGIKGRY